MSALGFQHSKTETEKLLTRAIAKENASDFDDAFRLYVESGQQFLQLSRTAPTQYTKAECRESAGKALQRAEKIKTFRKSVKPIADDPYSEFNQSSVLEDSARIKGYRYDTWTSEPSSAQLLSAEIVQPALSPLQLSLNATFSKPKTAVSVSQDLKPEDLIQNSVTDCSLIASIATCLNHRHLFGSQLLLGCFHPKSDNEGPLISPNGTYALKFWINGTFRRVIIDDALPVDPQGMHICAYSMKSGSTTALPNIFPALIEKAYMKLQGGYDFPGSNSGTDLYALTRWIPECIHIRGRAFVREKTWARLLSGFRTGKCLVTLGTGEKSAESNTFVEGEPHLLEAHCYTVLDIHETENGERTITFLDPWQDINDLQKTNEVTYDSRLRRRRQHSYSWQTICNVFDTVYASWDPTMWSRRTLIHRTWKPKGDQSSSSFNHRIPLSLSPEQPKRASSNPVQEDMWILLSRHIDRNSSGEPKFIALHVMEYHNVEVNARLREFDSKGTYNDDCHVLVKISSKTNMITLMASLDGQHTEDINYTLTIYSQSPVLIDKRKDDLLYSKTMDTNFTSSTSGGNFSSSLFLNNPQWKLKILPDAKQPMAKIRMTVEGEKRMALNGCLAWSNGQRIADVVKGDIVASTGEYRYGFTSLGSEIKPGSYTIIISTYTPLTLGPIKLTFDSSHQVDITPIPQEGAGMFKKVAKGSWKSGLNAGGSPKFGNYESNPIVLIKAKSPVQVKIRLRATPIIPLNLTLFAAPAPSSGLGLKTSLSKLGRQINTTGAYADIASGVVTAQLTLSPGTYIAVPSTYASGAEAEWEMIVYCDKRDLEAVLQI